MKHYLRTVSISMMILAPMAWGAGFQLNEFSVAAVGRANAGEPAMSDTAAAIARNPAVMGNFDNDMFSVTYHYIDPDISVKGMILTASPVTAVGDAKNIAPASSVGGMFYVHPIDDQWAFGIALDSHFGLSTDYGFDYAGTEFAQKTSIKTYYLSPSVSFKPVSNLSLGLSLNYIYGEGLIKNSSTPTIAAITSGAVPNKMPLLRLKGDGDALGYQLGITWDVAEGHRLGLRYESRVNLDFQGDLLLYTGPPAPAPLSGTLTAQLPEVYELGYVGNITDHLRMMAGIEKTGWGSFKSLAASIDQLGGIKLLLKDEDWKDVWRYSIGIEHDASDMLTFRSGLGYDESPIRASKRTLSIPDANRTWYTLGMTAHFKGNNSLDAAIMYIAGKKVDVMEPSPYGTMFMGQLSSVNVMIYSIGYNYSF